MSGFRESFPLAWLFHHNTGGGAGLPPAAHEKGAARPPREILAAPALPLPAPEPVGGDLGRLLAQRYSCRRFAADPVTLADLSRILFAAYGLLGRSSLLGHELLERPVPSAGGLYPLELYLVARSVEDAPPGVYHYAVIGHLLERVHAELPSPAALGEVLRGQPWLAGAPALVVITAVVERLLEKYGDRGYRYLLLEAGHAMQNLDLAALAQGLGTCNIGGFLDRELGEILRLDEDEEIPLYAAAVGHPAGRDRAVLRAVDVEPGG
ncbi:MAG: SagB/ThcOx family dehydrogenase [Planctomycetota bacterium]